MKLKSFPYTSTHFSKQLFSCLETYAIKWKNVNFSTSQITIGKVLDKFGNEKSTKGNKTTIFHIPNELKQLLQQWKV